MKMEYVAAVVLTLNWTVEPAVELMSVVKPAMDGSSELTCQSGVPGCVFSQATGFTTGAAHGLAVADAGALITSVGTTTAVATSASDVINCTAIGRHLVNLPCNLAMPVSPLNSPACRTHPCESREFQQGESNP
jgi:hypothetical protein